MIRLLRRLAAIALLSMAIAPPAWATAYSTDFSDIWWNAAESGWGVNIIQQRDVLFATFFIYNADNTSRWYVASNLSPIAAPSGTFAFRGRLFQTTGPWFGASTFNPLAVGVVDVGEVTFTFPTPGTGSVAYSINGVSVTKQITRSSFRDTVPTGRFVGGMSFVASGCSNPARNGPFNLAGTIVATAAGNAVTLRLDSVSGTSLSTCIFNGNWTQQGRLGSINNGAWACTNNGVQSNSGTFTLSGFDLQVNGAHATFTANDQSCDYLGRFGGIRDVN